MAARSGTPRPTPSGSNAPRLAPPPHLVNGAINALDALPQAVHRAAVLLQLRHLAGQLANGAAGGAASRSSEMAALKGGRTTGNPGSSGCACGESERLPARHNATACGPVCARAAAGLCRRTQATWAPAQASKAGRCIRCCRPHPRLFFSALICSSTFFSSLSDRLSCEMRCSSSAMCWSISSTAGGIQ